MTDIVVVGGGTAGCAVAGRLAAAGGCLVTLLEAGDGRTSLNTTVPALVSKLVMNPDFDWMYPTEADPSIGGREDIWPSGKRLGGGSAINGMMYIRGHADDYDRWRDLGAQGWDYDSCLPYFRRMEANPRAGAFHGSSGPVKVSETRLDYPLTDSWIASAQNTGLPLRDLNGDGREAIGVDRVQQSQWKGRRWSAADAYVRSGMGSGRLEVRDRAAVNRIVIEGGRAVGVEYRDGHSGEVRRIDASRGVVLSAGALASPKLLLLSGIGPHAMLRNHEIATIVDLPGVGANLQEHVGIHLVSPVNARTINSDLQGSGPARAVFKYLLSRSGPMTAGIATAQAMLRLDGDLDSSIQLGFSPFAFEILPTGQRRLRAESAVTILIAALHPRSRGRVSLRSADPKAPPLIEHSLLGDRRDVDLLGRGLERARWIMAAEPMRSLLSGESHPRRELAGEALEDYIRATAFPLFHPVGTCRIGQDDMAVVDPELRVRGVDGLWVADCSVAPELVCANTNATANMLGEKGSDHILARLSPASAGEA